MANRVRLSIRGTVNSLELCALPDAGRTQNATLGVSLARTTDREAFDKKALVARDVRRFALMADASEGTIAVRDVELRTLIRAELRECGIVFENVT